jgi:translation initiation factor IF-2
VSIVSHGVGPITEKDITEAQSAGAVLFGFDVAVQSSALSSIVGVSVHLHKLIYKFQEDIQALVNDVNKKDKMSMGRNQAIDLVGQAHVQKIF